MAHHNDKSSNGNGRHVRFDTRRAGDATSDPSFDSDSGTFFQSGRVLVTTVIVVVLLLWGGLNLVFRQWRAGYRERAVYGAKVVAEAIEPLAKILPSCEVSPMVRIANCSGMSAVVGVLSTTDVNPDAWRRAVEQSREMLVALTAANVLDRAQMTELGASVTARVDRAKEHPETARAELAALWDEISDRAGVIVDVRHPRPKVLPAKAKKVERGATSDS